MGGSRKLEITVVSAEDLPFFFLMRVYAVVSVDGSTGRSHADWEGDENPTWNSIFVFDIKESYLEQGGLDVVVNLFRSRLLGDRYVGQARLPVKDLFDKRLQSDHNSLSYPISGTPYGRLNIRYCFQEKYQALILPKVAPPPPPPPPPRKPMVTEMNLNYRTTQYLDDV